MCRRLGAPTKNAYLIVGEPPNEFWVIVRCWDEEENRRDQGKEREDKSVVDASIMSRGRANSGKDAALKKYSFIKWSEVRSAQCARK